MTARSGAQAGASWKNLVGVWSMPAGLARAKPFETMMPVRRSIIARHTRYHSRGPAFLPALSTAVKVPMNRYGARASEAVENGSMRNCG
ncbi:MAG: hypothetical protein R3E48_20345 [Burkholderiaceae bacterium]